MLRLRSWPIVRRIFSSRTFWILSVFVVATSYRIYLEYSKIRVEPLLSWTQTQTADCAVVLTGGTGRVREGFDLLANGYVKKLIISGVYTNARLREIMPVWTFYGALNENDVVLDRRSETTYGNAQQSLPLVEALRCRDILLVTSKTHMYRAFHTFRSSYPEGIQIHKYAIYGGRSEMASGEIFLESLKSLFYSIWAY